MSSTPKMLLETCKAKALITLKQPEIDYDIMQQINNHLYKWQDNNFLLVLLKSNENTFCTGLDLASLHYWNNINSKYEFREYSNMVFHSYNNLVIQINKYKPNFISFINGNIMGSGASISLAGKYRIITERTVLSMPETSIGFIPHGGASHFFNKLQGCLGLYLVLTGKELQGQELVILGIGTHYVPSDLLPELEEKLMECKDEQDIEVILDCYHRYEIEDNNSLSLKDINYCFNADKVEDILELLTKVGSKFCLRIRDLLMKKSPTSLKITFELWKQSKGLCLIDSLILEYNVTCRLLHCHVMRKFEQQVKPHSDMKEGMRTVFIEKDNSPKWYPERLEHISQLFVDSYFENK